ncbi:MAG: pyridoxal-phosphate dependent enzyme [Planctomycetota bacterium]
MLSSPSHADILDARLRIEPWAHRTPVLTSSTFNLMVNGSLFFKCENFQRAGAFKFRGACNAVFSLEPDDAKRGVVTHSSGNHAGALALAGRLRGIPVDVVMPTSAPRVKQDAVRGYGAKITFCAPTLAAREEATAAILKESGATLVHPFDHPRVIAGQGTAAMEFMEQVPDLDVLLTPVGGGGLLSGTLLAAKGTRPNMAVVGCEPANADDAFRSWKFGERMPPVPPNSIADGLLTSLGELTFPIIRDLVDDIVLVTEDEIRAATRLLLERMKIVVEPSSAVPFAAVLFGKYPLQGKRAGIILSGGNMDLASFAW